MADWILGFRKAARQSGPGVSGEQIRTLGLALPPELWALYQQVDGGVLGEDVKVFSVAPPAGERGLADVNEEPHPALPTGVLRFGSRGEGEHLVAGQRPAITALAADRGIPAWLVGAPEDGWAFALVGEHTGELRLFRSLERLLWTLVPPAEAEEFGESTFVRALTAVETALSEAADGVKGAAKKAVRKAAQKIASKRPAKARASASRSAGAAKKAAAGKGGGKRGSVAPARKATANKGAAARKPAAKKPAARKASPAKKAPTGSRTAAPKRSSTAKKARSGRAGR